MKQIPSQLAGVCVFETDVFGDERGYFMELWNTRRYGEWLGTTPFVQDNVSFSRRGILRGLHFQNPAAQGKLITVLQGEVYDVVVDLRRDSPTFGQWEAFQLSRENKRQVFVPPGFAHGFQVVSETVLFHYKCTDFYAAAHEHTLLWNDPELAIPWPVPDPVLSPKDTRGKRLREFAPAELFTCS